MPTADRSYPPDLSRIDLVPLVTHTKGKRPTQIRHAKETRVREVLQAGLRLVERHFAEPPIDGTEVRRYPAFQWLSRKRIADEVVSEMTSLRPGSSEFEKESETWENLLGDRWLWHDEYLADLLNIALHTQHWSVQIASDREALEPLLQGLMSGDFIASVQELAYLDVSVPIHAPSFQRMELLAIAMGEREPGFKEVVRENYKYVDGAWDAIYSSIFAARGWRLRDGFTINDLNLILSTAATGMGMRGSVDPSGIIDDQERSSLLGRLCLAIVAGCVDTGDGRSLNAVVSDVIASSGGVAEQKTSRAD